MFEVVFFFSAFLIFFSPLPLIAAIAFDYVREGWCRGVEVHTRRKHFFFFTPSHPARSRITGGSPSTLNATKEMSFHLSPSSPLF